MQPLKEKQSGKALKFMGKTEILQQWLDKDKDDLRVAEYLSTMHYPTPDEIICYETLLKIVNIHTNAITCMIYLFIL